MNNIEIITKDKSDLELLYEMAQRYCSAEQARDISLCDFYRKAGALIAEEIAEKQVGTQDLSFINYACSLFHIAVLAVSIGKTFEQIKKLLEEFGIK